MNNNDVMKKLRVALQLRDDDIVHILGLVDFRITKTELSGIFRAEDHENFKPCGDQILRNFLNGLIIYKRGEQAAADKTAKAPRPRSGTDENEAPKIVKAPRPRTTTDENKARRPRTEAEENKAPKVLSQNYEKRSTFIKPIKKKK
ncbi:MAG TPA: DUF1456 domain-containing protein [Bacteroidales bacterium]|nr:DUF1456 domain-containing protein [Bacteroidales bacterium]